jgi:hypothetical protein
MCVRSWVGRASEPHASRATMLLLHFTMTKRYIVACWCYCYDNDCAVLFLRPLTHTLTLNVRRSHDRMKRSYGDRANPKTYDDHLEKILK